MSINNDNNKQIAKELFRLAGNTAGNLFAGFVVIACVMVLLMFVLEGLTMLFG